MQSSAFRNPLTVVAMAAALAVPVPMSDPVGIYAMIDKVVLVPNATNPTAIQIWGTFAISDQQPGGDHYLPAVKGYLYYTIDPSKERATRAEWADLQGMAGKKAVVGFAAKYQRPTPGRVRCATEAPSEPDAYVLHFGVVKMPAEQNSGWPIAKGLLAASAPNAACRTSK